MISPRRSEACWRRHVQVHPFRRRHLHEGTYAPCCKFSNQAIRSELHFLLFLQWVLTTWTNEECTAILKNCYEALPEGGKLIACEPVVPETTDTSTRTRALLENDIFVMTTYRTQGRERSEEEFRQLGLTAGFTCFRALYLDPFYAVLEYVK
jgi:hypothetical protein